MSINSQVKMHYKALNHKIAITVGSIIFGVMCGHVYAQQSAIDNGLVYLHATQNPDGSMDLLYAEPKSLIFLTG